MRNSFANHIVTFVVTLWFPVIVLSQGKGMYNSTGRDSLPLAFSYQENILDDIRQFGVGIHFMYFSPNVDAISTASQGAIAPDIGPHLGLTAKARIINGIHLRATGTFHIGRDTEFNNVMLTALYQKSIAERWRPLIGAGWSGASFRFEPNSFIVEGGTGGPVVMGGVEYVTGKKTGVEIIAGYWWPHETTTVFEGTQYTLNLQDLFITATFMMYL